MSKRSDKKDAERYRWLRNRHIVHLLSGDVIFRIVYGYKATTEDGIDAAIDDAIAGHLEYKVPFG